MNPYITVNKNTGKFNVDAKGIALIQYHTDKNDRDWLHGFYRWSSKWYQVGYDLRSDSYFTDVASSRIDNLTPDVSAPYYVAVQPKNVDFKGKKFDKLGSQIKNFECDIIYRSKSDYLGCSSDNSSTPYIKNLKSALTLKKNTIGEYVGLVKSDGPDAYPDNGIKSGYWYIKQ